MAKNKKTVYFCTNCGYENAKWMGQCPACHEWNTFVEHEAVTSSAGGRKSSSGSKNEPVTIDQISTTDEDRIPTHSVEFDRVLGGGIVTGSLVLLGGDPGIGKSTLLLQVCRDISSSRHSVLYVSGEESLKQLKLRANRMGEFTDKLKLLSETDLEHIESVIQRLRPELIIIDSIQTMNLSYIDSAPGNASQIRESANVLIRIGKSLNIPIIIVGHVTKGGDVAGPRVLEHMVDAVLYLEGDRHASYRILRGVKNRFGSTNEIGVFEMTSGGLAEVENASEYMLSGRPVNSPGSAVTCSMEGTRPILIEVQALVSPSSYAVPLRMATGTDRNRASLLMAVLEKRCRFRLSSMDAYINIAGGIKVTEPAIDLGIIAAVVSSVNNISIPDDVIIFGETGLSGEVRNVSQPESRIMEAVKLGFKKAIVPYASTSQIEGLGSRTDGIKIHYVKNIMEMIDALANE